MSWIDAMRGASIRSVAHELGLLVAPARGASGGSIYGCPACGGERRHASRRDRRGAIGIRKDDRGWRCHECDSSGDAIDLVASTRSAGAFATWTRPLAHRCQSGATASPATFAPTPQDQHRRLRHRPRQSTTRRHTRSEFSGTAVIAWTTDQRLTSVRATLTPTLLPTVTWRGRWRLARCRAGLR